MKLGPWRRENKLTIGRLAEKLARSDMTVSRYCNERRIPEPETMRRIYVVTQGEVQPNDFYDLPELTDPHAAGNGQAHLAPDTQVAPGVGPC